MADLVEVSELHFSYDDRPILRGLSLKIPRGKVVAILGGSGSGKSTLLKLIGGQLAPERGWISVDGKLVHKLPTHELYALRLKMVTLTAPNAMSAIGRKRTSPATASPARCTRRPLMRDPGRF